MKPIVHFNIGECFGVAMGQSATIVPVDHTSPYVSNFVPATTSKIITIRDDGSFETQNTVYVPMTKEDANKIQASRSI